MKEEEILTTLKKYAMNEENQAGTKGLVIWEDDFKKIAIELAQEGKEDSICSNCGKHKKRPRRLAPASTHQTNLL